jgi:Protein of unknown function (DUF1552)
MSMILDRRGLLKMLGLAGGAAGFTSLKGRNAVAAGAPKRLIIFHTGHGAGDKLWHPTGNESNWTLGPLHQSLKPFKDKMVMAAGLDYRSTEFSPPFEGCGHLYGVVHSLTNNAQDAGRQLALNASFDQLIVNEFKMKNGGVHPTAQPYINMGIGEEGFIYHKPFFSGRGAPLPIDMDPGNVFKTKILPNVGTAPPPSNDQLLVVERRKMALDFVNAEIKSLRGKLGRSERDRLDQITSNVSDLSSSLAMRVTTPTVSCTKPAPIASANGGWTNTTTNVPKVIQTAFACDITRVIGVVINESPSSVNGWAKQGGTGDFHDLVHKTDRGYALEGNADCMAVRQKFYTSMADVVAQTIGAVDAIKEADGSSVLDNTIALWVNEVSESGHGTKNAKWIVFGSGGGKLRNGINVSFGDRFRDQFTSDKSQPSHGDFLLTLAQALDTNLTTFGDARAIKGPITSLLK